MNNPIFDRLLLLPANLPVLMKKRGCTQVHLIAGEAVSYEDAIMTVAQNADAEIQRVTAWRAGRLEFERRPLVEVITEFNRYTVRELVLDEVELQETVVTGVFRIGDVEALISALEALGLRVTRRSDGSILILTGTESRYIDPLLQALRQADG